MIGTDEIVSALKKNIKVDLSVLLIVVAGVAWAVHKQDSDDLQAREVGDLKKNQIEYNMTIKKMDRRLYRLELMNSAITNKFHVEWEEPASDDSK